MPDAASRPRPHPLTVVAHVVSEALRAFTVPVPPHSIQACAFGLTGGSPANFGGISTSALPISTATGLRSEP